jgi:hypothetical protein
VTLDNIRTRTQCDRLRNHLLTGRKITALEAWNYYGCARLASRVHDLKKTGMDIQKVMVKTPGGAHVAAYYVEAHQYQLGA